MLNVFPSWPESVRTPENIMTQRGEKAKKSNMACAGKDMSDLERKGSLLIESIVSQDEASDVVSIMIMAKEIDDRSPLPRALLHIYTDVSPQPYTTAAITPIIATHPPGIMHRELRQQLLRC